MKELTPSKVFYTGILQALSALPEDDTDASSKVREHLRAACVWYEEYAYSIKSFGSWEDIVRERSI